MANKPAERNPQARRNTDPNRRNIYVDGKFRAQLELHAAYAYADNEMRKGGSVFVTTLQYDVSEYMP